MEKKQQVIQYCQQFRTAGISANLEQIIANAEQVELVFWILPLAY